MNSKQILLAGIAAAILVAAGAVGWWIWRAVPVQVTASQRDVAVQVFGLGTVEARIASKIGFKVSGVLVDLKADVGDRVGKGATLARLDDREQTARLERAKAAVEQTEATLQRAIAGLAKAEVNYANARTINERRQKLVQSSSASVESAETAKTVQEAAQADVSVASGDIAVARAATGDARAQLQQETATLDFHTLMAPYDAMITARSKELGSALAAGEPVFTIVDPKTIWVIAFVDESKAGEIEVGAPAEIVLRSRPNERVPGKVVRIEPESDRVNEERRIAVAYERPPGKFNIGEQAEVYMTTRHLSNAVLVPEAAIIGLAKNSGTVWAVENGRLAQKSVTLGHRLLDGRYEITGGLAPDAHVVTALSSGLRDGRAVRIDEEPRR